MTHPTGLKPPLALAHRLAHRPPLVGRLALAELLIRKSDPASLAEATQLLDQDGPEIEQQGTLFRHTAIRYLIARARLARALVDANASVYAARALEIADETTPSLPRHPDLGRPNATDAERDELVAMLRS